MKDFFKWLFFGYGVSGDLAFAWAFVIIGIIIPGIAISMAIIKAI